MIFSREISTDFFQEGFQPAYFSGEISTCQTEEFRCSTGLCIPLAWQCDGEVDCPGEEGKVKIFFPFGWFWILVRYHRWTVWTNGTNCATQHDVLPESSNVGTRATASPRTGRATGTRTARTAATRQSATSPAARRSSSATTQTAFRQEAT